MERNNANSSQNTFFELDRPVGAKRKSRFIGDLKGKLRKVAQNYKSRLYGK